MSGVGDSDGMDFPSPFTHTHECRVCGAEIPCTGDAEDGMAAPCWDGGISGCPNESQHLDDEGGAL